MTNGSGPATDRSQSPTLADIEQVALQTVAALPEPFRQAAFEVVVQVQDWPPEHVLADLGVSDPLALTGLYVGIPLTEKSVVDSGQVPDMVWLFREPILDEWRTRDVTINALVAHVTIHEFAHHFGWSDAQIAAIDRWWE